MDGALECYLKEVKKSSLNQCYKPFQRTLCHASYYERLLVEKLKIFLLNFGGKKTHGRRGIHWCQWKYLCRPKEEGGLGIRNMAQFNISLLAKQGWRIINNPNSLVALVLKAKYFPSVDFLNSQLGNNISYTWKSIWAAKGILAEGLCWKVGRGTKISISRDYWIPVLPRDRLPVLSSNLNDSKVAELIDSSSRTWKQELIEYTFPEVVAEKILSIPLAEKPHDDFQVRSAEASGEFTVRSAYQLLQNTENNPRAYALGDDYKDFYRKLWLLDLPSKIKITVWKISWNFLATHVNMLLRRLTDTSMCPRCGSRSESMEHFFSRMPCYNISVERVIIS